MIRRRVGLRCIFRIFNILRRNAGWLREPASRMINLIGLWWYVAMVMRQLPGRPRRGAIDRLSPWGLSDRQPEYSGQVHGQPDRVLQRVGPADPMATVRCNVQIVARAEVADFSVFKLYLSAPL